MIIYLIDRHIQKIAWLLFFIFYAEMVSAAMLKPNTFNSPGSSRLERHNFHDTSVLADYALNNRNSKPEKPITFNYPNLKSSFKAKKRILNGGPGQPEMQSFQSVNTNNMVDLFSGDFSYNIPLIDVGGYPLGLSYKSGVTMDQEASWVGLGWNVNAGAIMRNVRGLPDDFNGSEKITKIYNVRKNWTAGITAAGVPEIFGFETPRINFTLGAFYNNYNGIGFEAGAGASVNPGKYLTTTKTTDEKTQETKIDTSFTTKNVGGSLSFSLNSQQGLNLNASFMHKYGSDESRYNGVSKIGLNYNSRAGLQDLQLSAEAFNNRVIKTNSYNNGSSASSGNPVSISFAKSAYVPTITMPSTSYGFSLTLKGGTELFGFHVNGSLKGDYSQQYIQKKDTLLSLPAYGYMHYQKGNDDDAALLDFNREKDIPFRSQTPHTAIPVYTYDSYSITGEGIGGSFRPYRGDVGYVRDHQLKTKNGSGGIGIDLGAGPNIAHVGGDIQLNYSTNKMGRWKVGNLMERKVSFQKSSADYEAVYFRNPSEQTTNTQEYYDKIGGDDVVRVGLAGTNLEPVATSYLKRFDKQKPTGSITVNGPIIKNKRDKRSQVISYLTAEEAQKVGLDMVIRSYPINTFPKSNCDNSFEVVNRNEGVNGTRKPNHISEITVLNTDGKRYVYGIPAYNYLQKEVTFAVSKFNDGTNNTGLVSYSPGMDNSSNNTNGRDNFFSSDQTPGFAHSFLLTGLLSPDYVDITGDGITEDDNGDAVKFNYSRMKWNYGGLETTNFKWRAPFEANKATFNDGLKTDRTDDKGSYVFGEKEIWYMNSIESKNMLATFVLDNIARSDDFGVNGENGGINTNLSLKSLKEINLYAKSDYFKNPAKARPIKTVHFSYSYKLCTGAPSSASATGKLTLDSIWFTYNGINRAGKNKYRFNYNPNNPSYNNKSYDRWGNYKPPTDNTNNIPNAEYPYATQEKTKADVNAGAWNLAEVKLPSGAAMKVDYEADDYAYVQNKRAMNMRRVVGMGLTADFALSEGALYSSTSGLNNKDYRYVFIEVPTAVSSKQDVYRKYLEGIDKIYFRMNVKMPGNIGYKTVPFYAAFDDFGISSPNRIWVRLNEFGKDQTFPAIAAIQFLRLNLPGKAYPGSDVSDEAGPKSAIKAVLGMGRQFKDAVIGFSKSKRLEGQCRFFDTSVSYVRLDNSDYRKYGGGLRVKKIVVTDNWYNMTGQKESYYGQEYEYNTSKEVTYDSLGFTKAKQIIISSGVASYEPSIGNEENPFRQPIEFQESVTMAPTDYLYSEYPYCESFFPGATVGYSKVRVSSINKRNLKSFSGWEESEFYTTSDFPTLTDYTTFDAESRKRGKRKYSVVNSLSLRRTTLSQGFKIELNDMNGKMKSQKSYAANDSLHPVAYTLNYFKTQQDNIHGINLSNSVSVLDSANGKINQTGTIGKDVELMMDFREQLSLSTGINVNANVEVFSLFIFPVAIPAFFPVFDIDENRFRSAVSLKVIQRYGILDSVVHYEKGSLISTKNMLYDSETGNVLLSKTQNEFNDPVYNFNYPAHWAYSGMGPAYKNIDVSFENLVFRKGILETSVNMKVFESGDEIYVLSSKENGPLKSDICDVLNCTDPYLVKNVSNRIWAVNTAKAGGNANWVFMDRDGPPYTADQVKMRIIRSGRRNVLGQGVGSITSLNSPVIRNVSTGAETIVFNDATGILASGAATFKDNWRVDNVLYQKYIEVRDTVLAAHTPPDYTVCIGDTIGPYSSCGTYIYSSYDTASTQFQRSPINKTNPFWIGLPNAQGTYCPYNPVTSLNNSGAQLRLLKLASDSTLNMSSRSFPVSVGGPLNRCGVWACTGDDSPFNKWIGFSKAIIVPATKTYFIGMAADNEFRFKIDGKLIVRTNNLSNGENFKLWHIYPVNLNEGTHIIEMEGLNVSSSASFGAEIYNNTETEIRNATHYKDPNNPNDINYVITLFSTKDLVGQDFQTGVYGCPVNYSLNTSSQIPGQYNCIRSTGYSMRFRIWS